MSVQLQVSQDLGILLVLDTCTWATRCTHPGCVRYSGSTDEISRDADMGLCRQGRSEARAVVTGQTTFAITTSVASTVSRNHG